jgi:hypothetical protein
MTTSTIPYNGAQLIGQVRDRYDFGKATIPIDILGGLVHGMRSFRCCLFSAPDQ